MLQIYLNGDSQTIGTDLPEYAGDDGLFVGSYALHLCELLGAKCIANPAVGGASNERILRTTNQMLDDCERNNESYPDFIVIGFSEYSRYDWFYNGKLRSAHADLDDLGPDEVALPENVGRWKWQSMELSRNDFAPAQISFYYNQTYNLHCRLEYLKIPHLFLNAHAGFYDDYGVEHRDNVRAVNLYEFDWDNCFWNVFATEDASFTSWAGIREYKDVPGWHYEHKAHIDFAQVMYDYIQSKDLLNKYKPSSPRLP
tara:strand:- start:529 stop:1296 length:768 start_codon:yes stop_codon:yes gene_type:complete